MKCYIQPGLNFHPTSLEFVVDDNRDYRAVLPPHLAEPGLPKDVARLVYFRLKSRNGNELTFLGDVGYSREYHCKVLKSPTTGKEICYVTFRGERLLLEASVYIHTTIVITDCFPNLVSIALPSMILAFRSAITTGL